MKKKHNRKRHLISYQMPSFYTHFYVSIAVFYSVSAFFTASLT